MLKLSREHAARYMLARNYLLDCEKLTGIDGIMTYMKQTGCVTTDSENGYGFALSLLARVKGISREKTESLLYEQRCLLEGYDRGPAVYLCEDEPSYALTREFFRANIPGGKPIRDILPSLFEALKQKEFFSTEELNVELCRLFPAVRAGLAREMADAMLFGRIINVHHREMSKRYFCFEKSYKNDLMSIFPFRSEIEYYYWCICRKLDGIGFIWDLSGEMWYGIEKMSPQIRSTLINKLSQSGLIKSAWVESLENPLFFYSSDEEFLMRFENSHDIERHVRILPDTDPILWDRRLISGLFDFRYKTGVRSPWREGHILPIIYGEQIPGSLSLAISEDDDRITVQKFEKQNNFHISDRFIWELEDTLETIRRYFGINRVEWNSAWLNE